MTRSPSQMATAEFYDKNIAKAVKELPSRCNSMLLMYLGDWIHEHWVKGKNVSFDYCSEKQRWARRLITENYEELISERKSCEKELTDIRASWVQLKTADEKWPPHLNTIYTGILCALDGRYTQGEKPTNTFDCIIDAWREECRVRGVTPLAYQQSQIEPSFYDMIKNGVPSDDDEDMYEFHQRDDDDDVTGGRHRSGQETSIRVYNRTRHPVYVTAYRATDEILKVPSMESRQLRYYQTNTQNAYLVWAYERSTLSTNDGLKSAISNRQFQLIPPLDEQITISHVRNTAGRHQDVKREVSEGIPKAPDAINRLIVQYTILPCDELTNNGESCSMDTMVFPMPPDMRTSRDQSVNCQSYCRNNPERWLPAYVRRIPTKFNDGQAHEYKVMPEAIQLLSSAPDKRSSMMAFRPMPTEIGGYDMKVTLGSDAFYTVLRTQPQSQLTIIIRCRVRTPGNEALARRIRRRVVDASKLTEDAKMNSLTCSCEDAGLQFTDFAESKGASFYFAPTSKWTITVSPMNVKFSVTIPWNREEVINTGPKRKRNLDEKEDEKKQDKRVKQLPEHAIESSIGYLFPIPTRPTEYYDWKSDVKGAWLSDIVSVLPVGIHLSGFGTLKFNDIRTTCQFESESASTLHRTFQLSNATINNTIYEEFKTNMIHRGGAVIQFAFDLITVKNRSIVEELVERREPGPVRWNWIFADGVSRRVLFAPETKWVLQFEDTAPLRIIGRASLLIDFDKTPTITTTSDGALRQYLGADIEAVTSQYISPPTTDANEYDCFQSTELGHTGFHGALVGKTRPNAHFHDCLEHLGRWFKTSERAAPSGFAIFHKSRNPLLVPRTDIPRFQAYVELPNQPPMLYREGGAITRPELSAHDMVTLDLYARRVSGRIRFHIHIEYDEKTYESIRAAIASSKVAAVPTRDGMIIIDPAAVLIQLYDDSELTAYHYLRNGVAWRMVYPKEGTTIDLFTDFQWGDPMNGDADNGKDETRDSMERVIEYINLGYCPPIFKRDVQWLREYLLLYPREIKLSRHTFSNLRASSITIYPVHIIEYDKLEYQNEIKVHDAPTKVVYDVKRSAVTNDQWESLRGVFNNPEAGRTLEFGIAVVYSNVSAADLKTISYLKKYVRGVRDMIVAGMFPHQERYFCSSDNDYAFMDLSVDQKRGTLTLSIEVTLNQTVELKKEEEKTTGGSFGYLGWFSTSIDVVNAASCEVFAKVVEVDPSTNKIVKTLSIDTPSQPNGILNIGPHSKRSIKYKGQRASVIWALRKENLNVPSDDTILRQRKEVPLFGDYVLVDYLILARDFQGRAISFDVPLALGIVKPPLLYNGTSKSQQQQLKILFDPPSQPVSANPYRNGTIPNVDNIAAAPSSTTATTSTSVEEKQVESAILSENPNVTWDDIAGLDTAKRILQQSVTLASIHPEALKGRPPARTILLYGPPGTGKTELARAVATATGSKAFLAVPPALLTGTYRGDSTKLIAAVFAVARKRAPSTLFFDELESIVSKRTGKIDGSGGAEDARVISQILTEMNKPNVGVFIIGATNIPWAIDDAVRRRFERTIYIPLPDPLARFDLLNRIISKKWKDIPHRMSADDIKTIVDQTAFFSGSDLSNLCAAAALDPVTQAQEAKVFSKTSNGKYEPALHPDTQCGTQSCVVMDLLTVPKGKLELSPITIDSFTRALQGIRPVVDQDKLNEYVTWTSKFGSSGR